MSVVLPEPIAPMKSIAVMPCLIEQRAILLASFAFASSRLCSSSMS